MSADSLVGRGTTRQVVKSEGALEFHSLSDGRQILAQRTPATLAQAPSSEPDRQRDLGYGGRELPVEQPYLPHFGFLLVTCERGDLRLSPNGITAYGVDGVREIQVERGPGRPGQGDTLDALWSAVREGRRDFHDARWGKATLEVALSILQSARERREVFLRHQVAGGD
jgi:phthalate 4,5-cis-dihydrodiol dehydrogenase